MRRSRPRSRLKRNRPDYCASSLRSDPSEPLMSSTRQRAIEFHERQRHGRNLIEVVERDLGSRLVGTVVLHVDSECLDLPFLRVDEGVTVEFRRLVLARGALAVVVDQLHQRGRQQPAQHWRVDRDALGALALISVVNRG